MEKDPIRLVSICSSICEIQCYPRLVLGSDDQCAATNFQRLEATVSKEECKRIKTNSRTRTYARTHADTHVRGFRFNSMDQISNLETNERTKARRAR